jgi:hypothetical protein
MVVDYRKLNEIAISDEFPLPKQEDILQALVGSIRVPATSYLVPLFTLIYLVLFHLLLPSYTAKSPSLEKRLVIRVV